MPDQLPLPGTEVQEDKLQILIALANRLEEQTDAIAEAEKALEVLKEESKNTEEVLIPQLMNELGLTELTLKSGRKIELKREFYPNITKAKTAEAMRWLREHGMGGIIKSAITIDAEHERELHRAGIPYELKETIHPQTLKALVREQITGGNTEFPKDIFSVFEVERAVVKAAR